MKKTFSLNRSGVIQVTPAQGTDFQCVKKGHTLYFYWCRVEFDNPTFDTRGFLADHSELDEFIKEQCNGSIESCELMVDKVGAAVAEWLAKADMPATSVYLKFASTYEGSQGFIEGTVYPSEIDNMQWKTGNTKGLDYLFGDYIKTADFNHNIAPPQTASIESEAQCESCECGHRRLKTITELKDDPNFSYTPDRYSVARMKGFGHFFNAHEWIWFEKNQGFVIPEDRLTTYGTKEQYYHMPEAHNSSVIVPIPVWATTCAPLTKSKTVYSGNN